MTATAHHHVAGPTAPGSVVLDLGERIGALVIHTTSARHGQEIEVSQLDTDGPAVRTHAAVRAREFAPETRYGAIIPALPAGRYQIWADATTPLDVVTVRSGRVAEYHWDDKAA
jgi:hypothetical protein